MGERNRIDLDRGVDHHGYEDFVAIDNVGSLDQFRITLGLLVKFLEFEPLLPKMVIIKVLFLVKWLFFFKLFHKVKEMHSKL